MNKKVILTICICLLSLAVGFAWAGEAAKSSTPAATTTMQAKPAAATPPTPASHADMTAMMAEMMSCSVCKTMAPHMAEFGPVMTMDVAKLNDGVAMMHGVSDPAKVATFHAVCAEMEKAWAGCMTMTDEQAKTKVCTFCQDMRSAIKAGAKMSTGKTEMGDIMVLTSSDPAVQAKLVELAAKCEMMAGSM